LVCFPPSRTPVLDGNVTDAEPFRRLVVTKQPAKARPIKANLSLTQAGAPLILPILWWQVVSLLRDPSCVFA
jgi:hypothetical protein